MLHVCFDTCWVLAQSYGATLVPSAVVLGVSTWVAPVSIDTALGLVSVGPLEERARAGTFLLL